MGQKACICPKLINCVLHSSIRFFLFNTQNRRLALAQHQLLTDRIDAAKNLLDTVEYIPVYVDLMDNKASKDYGGHPERLYIILDEVIEYQGGMGPFFYSLQDIEEWLSVFEKKMNEQNQNTEEIKV